VLHVGLTGGIGSGKSTVATIFSEMGAVCLDADLLVREMLGAGQEAARLVADTFGEEILAPDGGVDRKRLAARVFACEPDRKRLEAIVHPRVLSKRRQLLEAIRRERGETAVVITEAALIFEADTSSEFDQVILVTAPEAVRKARLAAAGWDAAEIEARMAAQWPDSAKIPLARWVVDNGRSEDQTRFQIQTIWPVLKECARAAKR
jgi:dephospho-CoA kinase